MTLAFLALWVVLGVKSPSLSELTVDDARIAADAARRERQVTLWPTAAVAVLFLALPLYFAPQDAERVMDGREVHRDLYSIEAVTLEPLGAPNSELAERLSHCLMYLGHADGITVLFDVNQDAVLRVPSGEFVVQTDPDQPSACD